jgi:hypothetical protein
LVPFDTRRNKYFKKVSKSTILEIYETGAGDGWECGIGTYDSPKWHHWVFGIERRNAAISGS